MIEKQTSSGVVFRAGGESFFLPANVAMKVLPVPEVARIPGAPAELFGVALVEGDMIPIIALGEPPFGAAMLLCNCLGEKLGLVGLEIVSAGRIDRAENARPFDVGSVIARVREGRWAV